MFMHEAKETADKACITASTMPMQLTPDKIDNPIRPGFGTQGEKIVLYSNHMRLNVDLNMTLWRYDISFPESERAKGQREPKGKKRKRLIQLLIEQHLANNQLNVASDYAAILVCVCVCVCVLLANLLSQDL